MDCMYVFTLLIFPVLQWTLAWLGELQAQWVHSGKGLKFCTLEYIPGSSVSAPQQVPISLCTLKSHCLSLKLYVEESIVYLFLDSCRVLRAGWIWGIDPGTWHTAWAACHKTYGWDGRQGELGKGSVTIILWRIRSCGYTGSVALRADTLAYWACCHNLLPTPSHA